MFVGVDIGNTHTVLAIRDAEKWIHIQRIPSSFDEETFRRHILQWCAQNISASLQGIGISSVVPRLTDVARSALSETLTVSPLLISPTLDTGITIRYDDPSKLGVDRLCSSAAAHAKYSGALIVVDFGTATTYDCVTSNGVFVGGVIAPGIETAMLSLAQRAAQLPPISLELPPRVLNTNTVTSIQAGVLFGALDAFEQMIERLIKELLSFDPTPPRVIATGGFSQWVAQHTSRIHHLEPMLVLDGIYYIWKRTLPS